MVIDELSSCLKACEELNYEQHQIQCQLFDGFRQRAWPVLSDPQCEWSPPAEQVRRKMWRLLRDLCHTPRAWTGSLSENLGYEKTSLVDIIVANFGEDHSGNAAQLVKTWDSLVNQANGVGPLRQLLSERIMELRGQLSDFRILATKSQQLFYTPILEELELEGGDVFCTASNLKRQKPFDALVTCGPFRENDFVFTAPRYGTIVNARWEADKDFNEFPKYLTNENRTGEEPQFPKQFPVRINEVTAKWPFNFSFQSSESVASDWSYDDFEQIYIPRNRRRSRLVKTRGGERGDLGHGKTRLRRQDSKHVQFTFFNDATLVLPFDQQDKPPVVLTIDPESDTEIQKRRPRESLLDNFEAEDDFLKPGMLIVIEPPADEELVDAASETRQTKHVHLPRWKKKVRETLAAHKEANRSVKFAMQLAGLDKEYRDVEGRLRDWCKYDPNKTLSPGTLDVFKKIVFEFAGYEKWEAAWEEVNCMWNESISVGLTERSNISQYLIASVERNFNEILSNPQTLLNVEGFSSEVIILELAEIAFISESQVRKSQIKRVIGLDLE